MAKREVFIVEERVAPRFPDDTSPPLALVWGDWYTTRIDPKKLESLSVQRGQGAHVWIERRVVRYTPAEEREDHVLHMLWQTTGGLICALRHYDRDKLPPDFADVREFVVHTDHWLQKFQAWRIAEEDDYPKRGIP